MNAMPDDVDPMLPPPATTGVTMPRPEDCAALDDCIDGGDATGLRAERAVRAAGWLAMWRHDPVADAPGDLVARTMARVADLRQQRRFAQQIAMMQRDASPRGWGFQWRELGTAAAVILIGLSLAIPVLDRTRADARRVACATNLAAAGMGLNQYAADHAGVMPRVLAQPGDPWWHVGEHTAVGQPTRSNSAHLYVLVRMRYVKPGSLNCPDNAQAPRQAAAVAQARRDWANAAAVSYSYQNQFTPQPIRLDRAPDLAVLADKNPLFVVRVHGPEFDSAAPRTQTSRFHVKVGPGQNVLTVSGNVVYEHSPVVTRSRRTPDNIWLLDEVNAPRTYTGRETPTAPDRDAFLVP